MFISFLIANVVDVAVLLKLAELHQVKTELNE